MDYLDSFKKIIVNGSINVQLIKVDAFSKPSVKINYEHIQHIKYEVRKGVLYVDLKDEARISTLRRSSFRPWIAIRYSELDSLFGNDFVSFKSELIRDIKEVVLTEHSELHVNNFVFTKDISIGLQGESSFIVYAKNDSVKNVSVNLSVLNHSTIVLGRGNIFNLNCVFKNCSSCSLEKSNVYNLSGDIMTTSHINMNICNHADLKIDDSIVDIVNISYKQKPNLLTINNVEVDKKTEQRSFPVLKKRKELLSDYRVRIEGTDILTFLNQDFCFENINENNRENILNLIQNLSIEEKDDLNQLQSDNVEKIFYLYNIKKKKFIF